MNDEIVDESVYLQLPFQQQTELISRYCGGIQEKISNAPTEMDAQKIADELCAQFHRSCSSDILRSAMTEYVQNRIRQIWT